jgi:hypothetical protein
VLVVAEQEEETLENILTYQVEQVIHLQHHLLKELLEEPLE